jgi:hypothetical protein
MISITRSQDRAKDGQTSVKLAFLGSGGETPSAAEWIQREFTLAPNETYQVQVRYFFATPGIGVTVGGGTRIMVGATNGPPVTLQDTGPFLQETASNGNPGVYRWLRKQYEFTAQTDAAGALSVMIGVLLVGGDLTYYVDSVRIKFTRRQAGAAEPVISSAFSIGNKVTIQGSAFGPSPRVLINNVDRTDFVTMSSPDLIKLKGRLSDLRTGIGDKVVVVDDTTAAASAPFDLIVTN